MSTAASQSDLTVAAGESRVSRRRPGAGKAVREPRYAKLRESLVKDIASGKYPVGSLLPPEFQLAETYGVSRHTVREATRKLADIGLISRRPGIGTVVCAQHDPQPYVAGLGTVKDLFDYTNATRLEVLNRRAVKANKALAGLLGCTVGESWVELMAFRHAIGQNLPISYTRVYLRPEFEGIEKQLRGNHISIYAMLERHFHQRIEAVRQEIEAALMPADAARLLGVSARSAALAMRRAYLDPSGRVLGVSDNLYPADRFRLVTHWNRDDTQFG
jgi:GntR family transcriptional regulator